MKRRIFLQHLGIAGGAIMLWTGCSGAGPYTRVLVNHIDTPNITFPDKKRIPLNWKGFAVGHNNEASVLHFPEFDTSAQKVWLRITAAIDFRERKKLAVSLAKSGDKLGVLDMWYAHPFQPFQIEIDPKYLPQIQEQGVALKMFEGKKDAWFFTPNGTDDDALGLRPQLLVQGDFDAEERMVENLNSMNSFSPFGWMGGCVQDALFEMAKSGSASSEQTLLKHLNSYLDDEKGIRFENPMTVPIDGRYNSIEDFLPFTAIVHYFPKHKAIQMALDYMLSKERENGLIATGHTTTEGCYTLAYPLAAIAVLRKDVELAEKAVNQLLHRKELLTDSNAIYQRAGKHGPEGYANWGRGTVWYLLGIVKTLYVLKEGGFEHIEGIEKVEIEFKRAAAFVKQFQNKKGLWYSFLDRAETEIDTTTSSGLGAAFAWGCKMGYLNNDYLVRAEQAYESLLNYITPDGFLTHVSQINRGGEELQSCGYRVISQFANGLLGQLRWSLKNQ